jgi:hypothetical protein
MHREKVQFCLGAHPKAHFQSATFRRRFGSQRVTESIQTQCNEFFVLYSFTSEIMKAQFRDVK